MSSPTRSRLAPLADAVLLVARLDVTDRERGRCECVRAFRAARTVRVAGVVITTGAIPANGVAGRGRLVAPRRPSPSQSRARAGSATVARERLRPRNRRR